MIKTKDKVKGVKWGKRAHVKFAAIQSKQKKKGFEWENKNKKKVISRIQCT
jgi:hypothetical protein